MSSQSLAVALLSVVSCVCLPVSAHVCPSFCLCVAFVRFDAVPCAGGLCLLDMLMTLSGNQGLGNHVVSQGHYLADVQAFAIPSRLGLTRTR